jgi:hypothetical protein
MPFHLPQFYGGLGNQLFSIVTIYSLSKKYNTTFSIDKNNGIATGFVTNSVYFNVFQCILECDLYLERNDMPVIHYTVEQFKDYEFDATIVKTHTIFLSGLPMKYSLFVPCINDIISMYHNYKMRVAPSLSSVMRNGSLCIAMRRFTNENSTHWATSMEYYKKAIRYMTPYYQSCTIHIYTDTFNSSELIMPFIKESFGELVDVKEFVGSKESGSDVTHLFEMFTYDNYILCNSTYHYWGALLTTNKNAIIIYPNECDWYKHISPEKWLAL